MSIDFQGVRVCLSDISIGEVSDEIQTLVLRSWIATLDGRLRKDHDEFTDDNMPHVTVSRSGSTPQEAMDRLSDLLTSFGWEIR